MAYASRNAHTRVLGRFELGPNNEMRQSLGRHYPPPPMLAFAPANAKVIIYMEVLRWLFISPTVSEGSWPDSSYGTGDQSASDSLQPLPCVRVHECVCCPYRVSQVPGFPTRLALY